MISKSKALVLALLSSAATIFSCGDDGNEPAAINNGTGTTTSKKTSKTFDVAGIDASLLKANSTLPADSVTVAANILQSYKIYGALGERFNIGNAGLEVGVDFKNLEALEAQADGQTHVTKAGATFEMLVWAKDGVTQLGFGNELSGIQKADTLRFIANTLMTNASSSRAFDGKVGNVIVPARQNWTAAQVFAKTKQALGLSKGSFESTTGIHFDPRYGVQ